NLIKVYCSSHRLHEAFKQEHRIHRRPNIVKLLAYADDDHQPALIMEFVPNGTLHHKLHDSKTTPLTWTQRVAVAFQLASAIAYLHDACSPHVVHAHIKPSNVLLDDDLNCKLCDFGSASVGFSAAVAPGRNDVYSFGVVVLELITGIEAFYPSTGERLAAKAARNAAEMVDPRLLGGEDMGEVGDLMLNFP
ncbi:salt tolerance receptor-like cytoplasmic kinase 1, partial [Salvia splendens]|uniref:salt tolerance receptor-like cytoplasmic kinase 1 n=1 Tax=Salvia splendens TaxID=180675 RepID=UPI001C27D388